MKDKLLKPGINFWFIIGTMAFFILSYFFYLQYYIPNKESKIIATRFRVLDQMGDNINAKVESYQNNAHSISRSLPNEVIRLEKKYLAQKYTKSDIVDYLMLKMIQGNHNKLYNEDLKLIYWLDERQTHTSSDTTYADDIKNNKNESDKYYIFDPFSFKVDDTQNYNYWVNFGVKYENIMYSLTRDDVFDQIFIVSNKKVVFSNLKADLILDLSNDKQGNLALSLASTLKPKLGEGDKTSDLNPGARIFSGEYSDLTISNENYKLFLKPVKVKGEYWYLGGLVKTENFHAAGRSIDQWIIVLLSMVLIMIVLGLPLIKLKVISKAEHLKTGSIVNSSLAVLLGASFLNLFILYLSQSMTSLINTDEKLMELSTDIDSLFTEEITLAFNQLSMFDSLYEDIQYEDIQYENIQYENGKEDENKKLFIENILDTTKNIKAIPRIYPFAEYTFWLTEAGRQYFYLTPFKDTPGEMNDLRNRDYFNKKDEWFFPPDPTKKFRLESIVSITSGNHLVAVSAKSNAPAQPVIALTSQFYSLIDPIIPRNYGFCIIDDKGKVWFHSNYERNLMENFISECNDNNNLKATLYNRTSIPFNINYYNKPHRAYVKPLKQLPLYLVTFYARTAESSFHAQVITITLIFVGLFFLLLFLQIAFLLIMDKTYSWKLMKNFILNITRPRLHLTSHYSFLLRIYKVVVIVSIVLASFVENFQSILVIFISEVIIFVYSYKVLNDNDLKRKQVKCFCLFNLILLVILNIGVFKLKFNDGLVVLAFEILLIVYLFVSYSSFKKNSNIEKHIFDNAFINNFAKFLIFLVILFSIFPSFVFYKVAYNEESIIDTRHYQIDAIKKKEIRNAMWNNNYASLTDLTSSGRFLQERKKKGIYTLFLNDMEFSKEPFSSLLNKDDNIESNGFNQVITFLRPFYNDENLEDKYLVLNNQNNEQNCWIDARDGFQVLRYVSNSEDSLFSTQDTMWIRAKADHFSFLKPYQGKAFSGVKGVPFNFCMWVILLFTLYIFYLLIRFGIRNLYSVDIMLKYHYEPFGKIIDQLLNTNKSIFIVKQSPSDLAQAFAKDVHFDVKLDWSEINFVEQSDVKIKKFIKKIDSVHKNDMVSNKETKEQCLPQASKYIVTILIEHFKLEYNDLTFFKKLNKLYMLIKQEDFRTIIISDVHPTSIVAFYTDIIKINSEEINDVGKSDLIQLNVNLNILQDLLYNVLVRYLPVKYSLQAKCEESQQNKEKSRLDMEGLVNKELNSSDYLMQFKNIMMDYYNDIQKANKFDNQEELILRKISNLAENYYENLFESCSDEEKYVIIDIAEDLIINQKNAQVIFGLLEKGILIKKSDRISFMNNSFQRLVLSKRSKSIIKELEVKIGKESSTWQGYRIVLLLVIASLFIFIAVANQDLMKNINQIFVMIGGAIASITGLLGLISLKGKSTGNG